MAALVRELAKSSNKELLGIWDESALGLPAPREIKDETPEQAPPKKAPPKKAPEMTTVGSSQIAKVEADL